MQGPVIASRLTDAGEEVRIEVYAPVATERGAGCAFRIDEHAFVSDGDDTVAALYTALTRIGELLAEANRDAARARFAIPAELGFPNPAPEDAAATPAPSAQEKLADEEVVAERVFAVDAQQHHIRLGRPFSGPEGQYTLCPFQVDDHRNGFRSVGGQLTDQAHYKHTAWNNRASSGQRDNGQFPMARRAPQLPCARRPRRCSPLRRGSVSPPHPTAERLWRSGIRPPPQRSDQVAHTMTRKMCRTTPTSSVTSTR
ncbi:DUF6968 family protein [Nocardia sp. NPDC050406]|uniref:DUF6968 family protein n=1 Tax=Nocardia sp. NPDC050406 TaxID=3364318 RepID=UPI0037B02E08